MPKSIASYEFALAQLGYNVCALDSYGEGIRLQSSQAAGTQAGKCQNNRDLLRLPPPRSVWRGCRSRR